MEIQTQIPPHNLDTEKAFLGSMILLGSIKGFEKITPATFYDSKHQVVYSSMVSVEKSGQPIDILTLTNNNTEIDGAYLVELVSLVPSHHNAEHYAKILKDKQLKRQLVALGEKITSSAFAEDTNVFDLTNRIENSLKYVNEQLLLDNKSAEEIRREKARKEAREYNGDDKVVSFASVAENLKNGEKTPRFMTTWTKLDELLTGFKPKHLIVLSGITKHGKTTFAMDMITKMADLNPLLIALEEPIEELIEKFVERGDVVPNGFSPIHASKVRTDWIDKKVDEGIEKFGSKIVFIDNLRWVRPCEEHKSANDAQRIADTVSEIKTIAKKYNVCIVLLVHVNKNSKADMTPTFEDFTGSADIAQLCDKAIIIWRETKRGHNGELEVSNNTNVSVQLNRQGGVGLVRMRFDNGHYEEYDWNTQDDDLDELAESGKTNKIF
jgi:replicative DNA helicase